ncbi:hypothetical protein [Campylobacter vicugnae]|uniref:hypothetical protein n=1 Tax=Campylobacter vicugnae TaxID=1660076 RepID=UPI000A35B927|nr:hypothetical protein [Campylobacter sp. S0112]
MNEVHNAIESSNEELKGKMKWNDFKIKVNQFIDKQTDRGLSDSDDYLVDAKELYFLEQFLKDLLKLFRFDEKKILFSEMDINEKLSKNELITKLSEELEKNKILSKDVKEKIEESLNKKSDLFYDLVNTKLKEFEAIDKDTIDKYINGEKEIFTANDFLNKNIAKVSDKLSATVDEVKDKATSAIKNVIKMR